MTDAQLETALDLYDSLKDAIRSVDTKYSMSYHEPDLDLPESLDLEELTYTAPTDAQINTMCEEKLSPWYTSELNKINTNYNNELADLDTKTSTELKKHNQKLSDINSDETTEQNKLIAKMTTNGIAKTSLYTNHLNSLTTKYSTLRSTENTAYSAVLTSIQTQRTSALTSKNSKISSLDTLKASKKALLRSEILEDETKKQQNITKYNQTLAEKETKYQASCKKALQYARQAEYERALTASQIYADLGETGLENQKKSEKLNLAKAFFSTYSRSDALTICQSDSFMQTHLGSYYSMLTDFINNLSA